MPETEIEGVIAWRCVCGKGERRSSGGRGSVGVSPWVFMLLSANCVGDLGERPEGWGIGGVWQCVVHVLVRV